MKTYHGMRLERCIVVVRDGRRRYPLDPKNDIHNHSPDFEWGYCGSGPAQLALALVADACQHVCPDCNGDSAVIMDGPCPECGGKGVVVDEQAIQPAVYQEVTRVLVAGIGESDWILSEDEIRRLVAQIQLRIERDRCSNG
jgi:hypothetical protein